ncbi:GAF domain-containing sensor histidine kinase [Nocardioides nanhaiensis]|uniref:Sensor-like histidine kinase SenX3 n=1 Tax=Nocardioides nanhaiensis TaxID=1476871 RepID=A0ABP8WB85_9ACTN
MEGVLPAAAPEDVLLELEERSRHLLLEGLALIVDGLVVALPRARAGVVSTGLEPALLAHATSECDELDGPASPRPPSLEEVLARLAPTTAEGGGSAARLTPDLCVLPLRDRSGGVRARLFVASGDPGTPLTAVAVHALVTAYAAHAERELRGSLEQQQLDEQVRLAEAAREVVRRVTARMDLTASVPAVVTALREGFRVATVLVREYADGPGVRGQGTDPIPASAREVRIVRELCARLWATQRVLAVRPDDVQGAAVSAEEVAALRHFTDAAGIGSALLVPVGFRDRCTGQLTLGDVSPDRTWSPNESEMALEIGRDLGRAMRNASSFAREQRLTAEMRAVEAEKSSLIATVSHELRGPLAAIVGHLELLSTTGAGSDDLRRALAPMGRGTARLQRVINDLTLLSRVGDPAAPPPVAAVDLGRLGQEAVELQRATAQLAGVEIRTALADDVWVRGDAAELDRALSNLLANAVKYGREGGRVELGSTVHGEEVVVWCRDDGIGIAPEYLPHLFTEFYRAADPHALERKGTGLGLAIVQRIARRHGGRVEVSSRPGKGSEFRLYLRAAPAPVAPGA